MLYFHREVRGKQMEESIFVYLAMVSTTGIDRPLMVLKLQHEDSELSLSELQALFKHDY